MKLTDMKAWITKDPSWSPDGRSVVFVSSKEGYLNVYVIDSGGGDERRVTMDPAESAQPSWSRDGKWIYFSSDRDRKEGRELYRKPVDGGEAVLLVRDPGGNPEAWESPDGRFVYYAVVPVQGIWRVPVGGGEPEKVIEDAWPYHWAMVDEGIYYRTPEGAVEFFDFSTEQIAPVMQMEKGARGLEVSPDRKWLLYGKGEPAKSDIMLVENFR
jgi:dipeptidyl aminopeptidase/acylaminoacyl peptidase